MAVVLALLLGATLSHGHECGPSYDKVNTFISTGGPGFGYGAINPAAQYPLSPMRLGPDTESSVIDVNYQHFSGWDRAWLSLSAHGVYVYIYIQSLYF